MTFTIMHLDGSMEDSEEDAVTVSAFPLLLDELTAATDEHPDVGITHESEWSLTIFRGGRVIWENLEDRDDIARRIEGLSRDKVLQLMESVASGDLASVEAEPWLPRDH